MHQNMPDLVLLSRSGASNPSKPAVATAAMPARHNPPADTCPVDHQAREAWLLRAQAVDGAAGRKTKSDSVPSTLGRDAVPPPPARSAGGFRLPFFAQPSADATPSPPSVPSRSAEACPVDHKAREAWLSRAANSSTQDAATSVPPRDAAPPPAVPSSTGWFRVPFFSTPPSEQTPTTSAAPARHQRQSSPPPPPLATDRVVSSIPRSSSDRTPPPSTSRPLNHEIESGVSSSGNWIYPSEALFFAAMRRKGHAPTARDMSTVVPMHNAVNERAWALIRDWESAYSGPGSTCGGPKLHSFAGDSSKLTPRARVNTWLGYTAPFDRHDWVVDRCGTRVEYVIDFYTGRQGQSDKDKGNGGVSFYLDVRPKLNSWEGIKMRAFRGLGIR